MFNFYKILVFVALVLSTMQAQAQYTFTSSNLAPYKQNFDSMLQGNVPFDNDGTNSNLNGIIVGYAYGSYFAPVPTLVPNDGSKSGSAAYNFGASGAADRALGGIAGGLNGNSGVGYIAVRLRNASSAVIKNLDVRYAIEQWYNSSLATDAYFRAAYRVYRSGATGFVNNDMVQATGSNGWTAASALDSQAPATGGILGQVNGNSTTYRRTTQSRLQGVNLAAGDEIVIRFAYAFNSATNGNGISMDDIVISPETNILYSTTSGYLNNTATGSGASWSLTADGSTPVSTAVDFSAPNVTYYVQGTTTSSRLSGNWRVTGDGSRVVVGTSTAPATLTLDADDKLTATVDVASGSTLTLGNTPTGLSIGTLAAGSTVQYTAGSLLLGSSTQSVLPATYAKLSLSGTSTKNLAGDVTVAENLAFASLTSLVPQAVVLGDYDLTMLRNATLSRTNGGQAVTNGTGEYRATVLGAGTASTPTLFPVALSAAASDYLPVWITAGVNSTGDDKDETYWVRAINGVYTTYSLLGIGSSLLSGRGSVNNTWHIGHETTTPVSATLKMSWSSSRESSLFARTNSYLDHYSSDVNKWDGVTAKSTFLASLDGTYSVQRTGVTKFSPFAVASNAVAPLPVVLVSFEAKRVGAAVACAWATASEQSNSHFTVERSLDGVSFQELGTVAGHGSSTTAHTYGFTDGQPVAGLAYYRLKQVDVDGTATYSPVVTVPSSPTATAAAITAVPNPSTGQFTLLTSFGAATQLQGGVVDMLGKKVWTINERVSAEAASLPIDLSAQPAGVYLVQLQGPAGLLTLRLLKQ